MGVNGFLLAIPFVFPLTSGRSGRGEGDLFSRAILERIEIELL